MRRLVTAAVRHAHNLRPSTNAYLTVKQQTQWWRGGRALFEARLEMKRSGTSAGGRVRALHVTLFFSDLSNTPAHPSTNELPAEFAKQPLVKCTHDAGRERVLRGPINK